MHVQDGQEIIEEEWDGSEPISHLRGNRFIAILAWFLLCAVLMWPFNQLHMGFVGLVIAMATAILILLWVRWLFRVIQRKMAGISLTRRQWAEMAMGVEPGEIVDEAEPDSTLAPGEAAQNSLATRRVAQTTALQPYSQQRVAPLESEDLPDKIIEPNGMWFSDRFMPALRSLLGQIIIAIGNRGFGKSNLLAVAAEEIAREEVPLLFIDMEDQYGPLAQRIYFPRGFIAGDPALQAVKGKPLRNFIPVNLDNARSVGRKLMQHTLQVVFNIRSYLTLEEGALVLCQLIKGIMEWEEARENEQRLPIVMFWDEANKIIPQEEKFSELADRRVQDMVYKTAFGLVNRGRNYGISVWFASQRIQLIHKTLLQASYKFLFYQGQKVDLEQYQIFGLEPEDVLTLQQGECYIFAPTVIGFRCFIRERVSPHLGHTPGLEQLRSYQQTQLRPIHTLNGGQISGQLQDPYDEIGTGMTEQIAFPPKPEPVLVPAATYPPRTDEPGASTAAIEPKTNTPTQHGGNAKLEGLTEMQKLAYELHMQGHTTIVSLAAAMTQDRRFGKVDNNVANRLRYELAQKRLITINTKGRNEA